MQKLLTKILTKKLVTKNKGYTFVEVIISLLLLSIFIILLSSIVRVTSTISKKFVDFTDYEYAILHKKITDIYEDSQVVTISGRTLYFENKDKEIIHSVNVRGNKIYKQTKNEDKNSIKGYSLLLSDANYINIKVENDDNDTKVIFEIQDRLNHNRYLHLRLKNELEENKKDKENNKRESEDSKEKNNEDNKFKAEQNNSETITEENNEERKKIFTEQ